MKKFSVKWMAMVLAVSLLCMNAAAYAHPDLILTDSFPIAIFDGVKWTKDSYFETAEYDEWHFAYADRFGGCYEVEYPHDDICNGKTIGELVEYLNANGEALIADGTLELSGYAAIIEHSRLSLGEKEDVDYKNSYGIYLIPLRDGKTAVLDTPEGYVFLGGVYNPMQIESWGVTDHLQETATEQSGWRAAIFEGLCSAQRFSGDADSGYLYENEMYWLGDLTDKFEQKGLMILPLEDVRGKMASEMQNWALEQAIEQSQAEGFDEKWQEWVKWNEQYID